MFKVGRKTTVLTLTVDGVSLAFRERFALFERHYPFKQQLTKWKRKKLSERSKNWLIVDF